MAGFSYSYWSMPIYQWPYWQTTCALWRMCSGHIGRGGGSYWCVIDLYETLTCGGGNLFSFTSQHKDRWPATSQCWPFCDPSCDATLWSIPDATSWSTSLVSHHGTFIKFNPDQNPSSVPIYARHLSHSFNSMNITLIGIILTFVTINWMILWPWHIT